LWAVTKKIRVLGAPGEDRAGGGDAVEEGHDDVGDDDVGVEPTGSRQQLPAARGEHSAQPAGEKP
jgi:hypothetical protein